MDLLDLRSISEGIGRHSTLVCIKNDRRGFVPWIKLGTAELNKRQGLNNVWSLKAYCKGGITDFEHDTIQILRLPIIGVDFQGVGSFQNNNEAVIGGFVEPGLGDMAFGQADFRVPSHGYDPTKAKSSRCRTCTPSHKLVNEDWYLPAFNEELYNKVSGREIRIFIGPHDPEDD